MIEVQVPIQRIDPAVRIPQYQSPGAVAFDIAAAQDIYVNRGEIALVPTGLVVKVPDDCALLLCSRSSAPKKYGIIPPHGLGVIDQDYCGPDDELKIQVMGLVDAGPFLAQAQPTIYKGDRIAQGLLVPCVRAEFVEVESSMAASRGGFGSTG
jgi:dUTP pyrophosphatase